MGKRKTHGKLEHAMDDADRGELAAPGRGRGRGSRAATRPANRVPAVLQQRLDRAREAVWCRRSAEGSWAGTVTGDVSAVVDYLLLMRLLGLDDTEQQSQLVAAIRGQQLPLSAWSGDAEGPL